MSAAYPNLLSLAEAIGGKPSAVVVGAGPAGLMAAERLAARGAAVTVLEAMPSPGRKLLMAGRGGLNLTHGEDWSRFVTRYGAAQGDLRPMLDAFDAAALRDWCAGLGIDTFVGSSGRVFPTRFKASPLLRAWLARLDKAGVRLAARTRWQGFAEDGGLLVCDPQGETRVLHPQATVLALGGASWPRLGSDGRWFAILQGRGVPLSPLRPANCGFAVDWPADFAARHAGQPLKSLALRFGERQVRGEAMITVSGIEGGGIYALSSVLREAIAVEGEAVLHLDFKPDLTVAALAERLARPRHAASLSNFLRKATGLSPAAVALLRGDLVAGGPDPAGWAARIKALPLRLTASMPLARAISTAGGVRFDGVDGHLMLKALPGVFVAGEMLDWEAPTGGYLLTACFATGAWAGEGAASFLRLNPPG